MLSLRPDLQTIANLIAPRSRVLDIGCGDGALLAWLAAHKQVDGRGIEIDMSAVHQALAHGVSVVQGDVNHDLQHYPESSVDVVVLSQALQMLVAPKEVLSQLLRIGKQAIVSVPNFGHWKSRMALALGGKMPVTQQLAYSWYDTPNIHFCTIRDFVELCEQMNIKITHQQMVDADGVPTRVSGKSWRANVLGTQGIFVLERR